MDEKKKTKSPRKQLSMDIFIRRSAQRKAKAEKLSLENLVNLQDAASDSKTSQKRFSANVVRGSKKKFLWPPIAVIIAVVVFGGVWSLRQGGKSEEGEVKQQTSSNNTAGTIQYQTVLPSGKSIDDLGGWQRVSPPEGDPVFAYSDTIDGVAVTVTQQPLPKSPEGGVEDWVADLAKKFNASTRIAADDTSVYVGTSAKGPQSVIFTKNDLLILIKSESKIKDQSWATYARALN